MSIPPTPIPRENPGAGLPYGALEHAAKYLVLVQMMRLASTELFSIALHTGAMGLLMCMVTRAVTSNAQGTLLIGGILAPSVLFLLATGVENAVAPSRGSMVRAGVSSLFASISYFSAWYFFFASLGHLRSSGKTLVIFFVVHLVIILGLGVLWLWRYIKDGASLYTPPLPLSLTLASDLLNRLRDASSKATPEFIQFSTWGRVYRCLLLDDMAILARINPSIFQQVIEIHFLPSSGLAIESDHKKCFGGRRVKGKFRVNGKTFSGSISPESLARYQAWKERFQAAE